MQPQAATSTCQPRSQLDSHPRLQPCSRPPSQPSRQLFIRRPSSTSFFQSQSYLPLLRPISRPTMQFLTLPPRLHHAPFNPLLLPTKQTQIDLINQPRTLQPRKRMVATPTNTPRLEGYLLPQRTVSPHECHSLSHSIVTAPSLCPRTNQPPSTCAAFLLHQWHFDTQPT